MKFCWKHLEFGECWMCNFLSIYQELHEELGTLIKIQTEIIDNQLKP